MAADIQPYVDLIRSFVDEKITASEFEQRYLSLFKTENEYFDDSGAFDVLDGLFAAVDEYVADPEIRDEDDLDDEQLHSKAVEALRSLGEHAD